MYTLVLLASMSPGADVTPTPAPAAITIGAPVSYGCGGCTGCIGSGCGGYVVTSGCNGCTGCYGCVGSHHGGLFHGHRGHGLFGHHKNSCHGCAGYSCSGWNCFGSCNGGCNGCLGACYGNCYGHVNGYQITGYWSTPGAPPVAIPSSGTFGYVGSAYFSGVLQGTPWTCHGGCFGGYYGGGSSWGAPVTMHPYTLHGYNVGSIWGSPPPGIYGNPQVIYGTVTNPNPAPVMGTPVDPKTTTPSTTDPKAMDPKGTSDPKAVPPPVTDPKGTDPKGTDPKGTDPKGTDPKGTGANLKFQLPADAKLFVDGRLTLLTGTERVFTTPPLTPGQRYFYDIKAVLQADGAEIVEQRRVIVEAGANLTESFPKLQAAAELRGRAYAGK